MWLPILYVKTHRPPASRDVFFIYLLIITASTIIKANAIMVNNIFAYIDSIKICIIVSCTIRTTSLSM